MDHDVIQKVTLPLLPPPYISLDRDTSMALSCSWSAGTCLGAREHSSVISASFWVDECRGAPASAAVMQDWEHRQCGGVNSREPGTCLSPALGWGVVGVRGEGLPGTWWERGEGWCCPPTPPPFPPRALAHDSHPLLPDGGWGAGPGALGK